MQTLAELRRHDVRDYPRPVGRQLAPTDLRPADVLLSRGTSEISDAIVAADGASYSHAALWSGERVIEAVLEGILERDLIGERDVYRFGSHDSDLPDACAQRIVRFARQQVGQVYARSELFMLGVLFSMGLAPSRPVLDMALRALGGPRAEALAAWLQSLVPAREPMMCSELVARAYYDADLERRYALQVVERAARPAAPETLSPRGLGMTAGAHDSEGAAALSELQAACARLVATGGVDVDARSRKLWVGQIAQRAGKGAPLGVVTPGDLQFSTSLRFVGCIRP